MSIAYVRDLGEIIVDANGSSSAANFSVLPAVGNYVITTTATYASASTHTVAASDNQSNSYTTRKSVLGGGLITRASICDAKVDNSSGTFTVTITLTGGSSPYYSWTAAEFSGLAASSPADQTGGNEVSANTTVTVTTDGNLAENDELVVSACAVNSLVDHTSVTASGFNAILNEADASLHMVGGGAYKLLSGGAGATTNAVWSWTTASAFEDLAAIATYMAASGPAPDVTPLRLVSSPARW